MNSWAEYDEGAACNSQNSHKFKAAKRLIVTKREEWCTNKERPTCTGWAEIIHCLLLRGIKEAMNFKPLASTYMFLIPSLLSESSKWEAWHLRYIYFSHDWVFVTSNLSAGGGNGLIQNKYLFLLSYKNDQKQVPPLLWSLIHVVCSILMKFVFPFGQFHDRDFVVQLYFSF